MTDLEAVNELKMLYTRHRSDFYPTTREALTIAINALYERRRDEQCSIKRTINGRP